MKYSAAFLFASAASVAAARSRLDRCAYDSRYSPANGAAPTDCRRYTTVDVVRELGAPPANDFPTISIAPLSKEQREAHAHDIARQIERAPRRAAAAAELGCTAADLEAGEERARQAQAKRDRKNSKRKP